MKTEAELVARIAELKAQGSPSALSKAREIEMILGLADEADHESDAITDVLLKNQNVDSLWDQLPEFVSDHQMYTFWKQGEALKVSKPKDWDEATRGKWDEKIALEEKKWELEHKGKAFRWRDLIGQESFKTFRKKMAKKRGKEHDEYESGFYTKIPDEAASIESAELIASLTKKGTHRPLLDLDIPVAYIPSTTPGHGHLYIDKELSWKEYQKLLNLLADLDIIEHGYRGASLARGYSALRLPWIKKEKVLAEEIKTFE